MVHRTILVSLSTIREDTSENQKEIYSVTLGLVGLAWGLPSVSCVCSIPISFCWAALHGLECIWFLNNTKKVVNAFFFLSMFLCFH